MKEAVLMLSTYAKSQNKPMVIGFNGKLYMACEFFLAKQNPFKSFQATLMMI